MSAELSFRKSVRNLTDPELTDLRETYKFMMSTKDNRGYHYLAGFHGWPHFFCWHHQMFREEYYGIRMFLPWHRAYLYRFEQAIKDRNENASLPWWDWSSDISHEQGLPKAFSDATFQNNELNPLYSTDITYPSENPQERFTERDPSSPQLLPTKDEVTRLLNLTEFSDFNDALENIHDRIHGWVGGSMGIVSVAAFDPIFWSHHCMVDRLWYLWQLQHGNSGMPANMYDMPLEPFNLRVRDVLNINDLGYEYAGSGAAVDF